MSLLSTWLLRSAPAALAGAICLLIAATVALDVVLSILSPLGDLFLVAGGAPTTPPEVAVPVPDAPSDCTEMPGGLVVCD